MRGYYQFPFNCPPESPINHALLIFQHEGKPHRGRSQDENADFILHFSSSKDLKSEPYEYPPSHSHDHCHGRGALPEIVPEIGVNRHVSSFSIPIFRLPNLCHPSPQTWRDSLSLPRIPLAIPDHPEHLKLGNGNGPFQKLSAPVPIATFLPKDNVRPLQRLFRLFTMTQRGTAVSTQSRLTLGESADKFVVRIRWGGVRHGGGSPCHSSELISGYIFF